MIVSGNRPVVIVLLFLEDQLFDPCLSNPCENLGTCRAVRAYNESFLCQCSQPYEGLQCNSVYFCLISTELSHTLLKHKILLLSRVPKYVVCECVNVCMCVGTCVGVRTRACVSEWLCTPVCPRHVFNISMAQQASL